MIRGSKIICHNAQSIIVNNKSRRTSWSNICLRLAGICTFEIATHAGNRARPQNHLSGMCFQSYPGDKNLPDRLQFRQRSIIYVLGQLSRSAQLRHESDWLKHVSISSAYLSLGPTEGPNLIICKLMSRIETDSRLAMTPMQLALSHPALSRHCTGLVLRYLVFYSFRFPYYPLSSNQMLRTGGDGEIVTDGQVATVPVPGPEEWWEEFADRSRRYGEQFDRYPYSKSEELRATRTRVADFVRIWLSC